MFLTGVRGDWFQLLGSKGARPHVILVLRECIWNVPAVSIVPSAFDDTSSLGSPPRQVFYTLSSMVPPRVTASHILAGNSDATKWVELHEPSDDRA